MQTTLGRVTTVVGTDIVIIAVRQSCVGALPCLTRISQRTLIAIVAILRVGQMGAESILPARIVGAGIAIITVNELAGGADTIYAAIIDGAWIAVVTGPCMDLVGTSCCWLAAVTSAYVVVVAIGLTASLALTVQASVNRRAQIAIITGAIRVIVDAALL